VRISLVPAALLGAAWLLSGCGSEPPQPGELTVTSEPAGAAIALDGQATGKVTPHTFAGLEGGSYVVSVSLEGWATQPGQRTVEVPFGGRMNAAFTLSQAVGSLTVTSTPSGAAIYLDGEDSGFVTPHTFAGLVAGQYEVTVALDNHASDPADRTVDVPDGGEADADFQLIQLTVPRVVLFEGFSNVFCSGCPTFNANVHFVQGQDGYGPERLLYVKWPAFLSPLDPFYNQTSTLTNARVSWYDDDGNMSLPTCYANGALIGSEGTPLSADGMVAWIDSQPAEADVDLQVALAAGEDLTDIADLSHEATVTLRAPGGLDLTGHELHVVLVYEEVETGTDYPFGNGDLFHNVMRDHVIAVADLGVLAANEALDVPVTVNDPDPTANPFTTLTPHGKQILAWIQDASTQAVLQAGSTYTLTTTLGAAPTGTAVSPHAQPGGTR